MTGTRRLVWLYLRRDRVTGSFSVLFLVLLVVGVAKQYAGLLPTEQHRIDFAAQIRDNAALTAFTGQLYGDGLGNLTVWKIGDIAFTLVALMAVLNVVRHTRAEEESGRAELLGAGVIGRLAPMTASLIETGGLIVLSGALTALGLAVFRLDVAGAVMFGLALSAPGLVLAAVAAVAAQLSERARTAIAMAASVLGAGYMIRFLADGSGVLWLRWLSPNGWSHLAQPFGDNRWWVLLVPLAVTASLTILAYRLNAHRDLGTGVLPARLGSAEATPGLRSPLSLAWRGQRGQLLGWTAGLAALSTAGAGVAPGMRDLADRSGEQIQELFRRYAATPDATLSDTFVWMIAISVAGIALLYPLLTTLRLRGEEISGRAELLLSTTAGRTRWALSQLILAFAGSALILTVSGLAAGLGYGLASGDLAAQLPRILLAFLVMVPPVWCVGAVAMLAFGVAPKLATALAWVVFVLVNVFGEALGPILGINYWIANQVIPFHHIPKVITGGQFTATPLLILTALAVVLAAVGLTAFQRRDLT
ncbi:ABC transporter permease [Nonomuraea diastatica]|uniref:ABC transporter permease n=1 Tax=Nonomuraea diastatica TaxID=1848329 RepID=A0A4R4X3E4_9ACTN|nr:ABC transporter permease [Nonomuraea diastatica]TDD24752.1 ABC transporter permease [Nonomuraea diastatica]